MMNRIAKIILSTIMMISMMPSNSQEYFAFPTDTATWSETCEHFETYPYPHWEYYTIKYFLDGDTAIDSTVYSKVYGYSYPTAEIDTLNANLMGGLREDSLKHIYFLPFWQYPGSLCYMCITPFPPEYLLYRFDLDVGDTASIGHNSNPIQFVVSSIDSILIDSFYRKTYNFNFINRFTERYWIEGIGSSYGLFGPLCDDPFEGYVELLCYQDPYTNYSKYGYCYNWFYVPVPENEAKVTFTISPNPAKTRLIVSMQGIEWQGTSLKVRNVFGQEIFKESIVSGSTKHEIDISKWEPGIFVFRLYRKGELLQTKKVVVVR